MPLVCWVLLSLEICLSRRQAFNLPVLGPQLIPIVLNEWRREYDLVCSSIGVTVSYKQNRVIPEYEAACGYSM